MTLAWEPFTNIVCRGGTTDGAKLGFQCPVLNPSWVNTMVKHCEHLARLPHFD